MKIRRGVRLAGLIMCSLIAGSALAQDWWRSSLYGNGWTAPTEAVSFLSNKFLQDFSYAGYHRGEQPIPQITGPVFHVADYGAVPNTQADSSAAIQAAINAAGQAGGGVVQLAAGTYRVSPGSSNASLVISHNGVVLRGEGTNQTFLLNTQTSMRGKSVVRVQPPSNGNWSTVAGSSSRAITQPLTGPTRMIPVADTSPFSEGDWVTLRADVTEVFIEDLNMSHIWDTQEKRNSLGGPFFYRQILAVDPDANTLEIDAPIRFILLPRDNARVHRTAELLEEVGLEDFSIGNVQHPGNSGWGENDHTDPNNSSYDTHGSFLVRFMGVRNSWMDSVRSYRAPSNTKDLHMLSNGVLLVHSRGVTLRNVEMQRPQFGGGGGNGYMIRMSSANECLVLNSTVRRNRHGFVFSGMRTSGNVIRGGMAQITGWQFEGGRTNGTGNDHHSHLSQANLIDGVTLDRDYFTAHWRGLWGGTTAHALTSTGTVYWNLHGQAYLSGRTYIVQSEQFAYGYMIGTRGPAPGMFLPSSQPGVTDPADHAEGEGMGDTLWPPSLYDHQLQGRLEGYDPGPLSFSVPQPESVRFPDRHIELTAVMEDAHIGTPTFEWEQLEGPYPAHFIDSDSVEATAVVDVPGFYRFRLTVTRGEWVAEREVGVWANAHLSEEADAPAEAATFVRGGTYGDDAYGAASSLQVKNDGQNFSRQAFVRFPIPESDYPVARATLEMTPVSAGMENMLHDVVQVEAAGWEESTLTWNTQPAAVHPTPLGQVPVIPGETWSLDVTDAVNNATGAVAFRLWAVENYGAPGFMSYAGRTHSNSQFRPRLVVNFEEDMPDFEEWMAAAAGVPPELQGPRDDASGDGQPNLLAYLRGHAPDVVDHTPFLTIANRDGAMVVQWHMDMRISSIPYRIEWTPSLRPADWKPVTGAYRFAGDDEEGNVRELETEIWNPGVPQSFFRFSAFTETALKDIVWEEVFHDPGTGDWNDNWFLDGNLATVTNSPSGMDFTAGTQAFDDAHHAVLWTRQDFSGDLKIEYEYTRLDNELRMVNILFIHATGSGEPGYEKDIHEWADKRTVPAMRLYFENMNAYHISYAAFDTTNTVPGNDYIRARRYVSGPLQGTELENEYEETGFFETGVPHQITIVKRGRDLFMHVQNDSNEADFHFVNSKFPPLTEGRIGLRHMYTRGARYKDFTVSIPKTSDGN
ncbi:MAG: DNRLRE domain-containing protein [Verrucomicrobia bacterium]|nr:DNRLRE domain-containing protein [Verrucomicrobiota bacterium]MCH8529170.1 DNRLRE domain-containing protein [Kiritimatiellia bacterium]